ncbi:hypothetical protein [Tabrizicola sp.]|uniref:hypothetical protein n=1 Tax=Tabrizicola sp. TaxID=2005166 RepID=UPI0035AFFC2D
MTVADIVRATITVGRANRLDLVHFGIWSRIEILWRFFLLRANIKRAHVGGTQRYVPSQAFNALDPSEKGAVTYFLAGAAAKLVSERFGIEWLLHHDVYSEPITPYGTPGLNVSPTNGIQRKPDFIGVRSDKRVGIFESKGRTRTIDRKAQEEAKYQTTVVKSVNGHAPTWRIATLLELNANGVRTQVIDPPEVADDSLEVDFEFRRAILEYYCVFLSLFDSDIAMSKRVSEDGYLKTYLPELDIQLGIGERMYAALRALRDTDKAPTFEHILSTLREAKPRRAVTFPGLTSIGSDGLSIKLGRIWDLE